MPIIVTWDYEAEMLQRFHAVDTLMASTNLVDWVDIEGPYEVQVNEESSTGWSYVVVREKKDREYYRVRRQ